MGGISQDVATLGIVAVIATTMLASLLARVRLSRSAAAQGAELALYQAAMLAGGPGRVSDTALSYLVWSGMLEVRDITDRLVRVVGVDTVKDLHPVETAILAAVDPSGVRPEAAMGAGRIAARHHIDGLDGLAVDTARRGRVDALVVMGCALAGALGGWWVWTHRGSAAGFVPLLILVAGLYVGWWFSLGRPKVTRSGAKLLEQMRTRYDSDLEIAAVGVTSLPLDRAMYIIALYGRDALTGSLSGLRKVMTGNPSPVSLRSLSA